MPIFSGSEWVLTAGHCTTGDGALGVSVLLGAHNRTANEASQVRISLRDLLGNELISTPLTTTQKVNQHLVVDQFPEGIYLIGIEVEQVMVWKKLIISRE